MSAGRITIARKLKVDEGGAGLEVWGKPDLEFSEPLCLFVHGYNVEERRAVNSAVDLLQTIERRTRLPSVLTHRLWVVFWNGHAENASHERSTLSALSYSKQIQPAIDTGRTLADYLVERVRARREIPHIHLIGHSLGCRVVLEMLEHCARSGVLQREHFPTVVLMGAAVPIYMLETPTYLQQGALLPSHSFVVYSPKDRILSRLVFGSGQSLAGEGTMPSAVGRTGHPPSFWDQTLATRNTHSGYFTDPVTADAVVADLAAAPTRRPPERQASARIVQDQALVREREVTERVC